MNKIIDIKNCARCQGDHEQLEFKVLTTPIDNCSHFAMCPKINEPILLEIRKGGDKHFGKECKCSEENRIGQTWCCNHCGLPTAQNDEMQGCECGHTVPLEFAVGNDDGQYTCMPCYIDIVSDPEARKDFLINPQYLLVPNPNHEMES